MATAARSAPAQDDFWGGAGEAVGDADYGAMGGYQGGGGYQGLGGNYGNDPFAYSGGSLLTPWTQQFVAPPGSAGGGGGVAMSPFHYGDFNYDYHAPGAYDGYTPAEADKFGYSDFQSPDTFHAPTAADLAEDPSYQFRLAQGQDALQNSASASGLARTGGFAKAMSDYNQQAASQEYGNVYQRKAAEYDRTAGLARQDYASRRQNATDNSDRNFSRTFQVGQANNQNRLAAYQASTDALLRGSELGYNIATGGYDRNRQNAKDAYDSALQIAQANASAGNASADKAYNRALDEYKMAYDIFNNNQTTQYNRTLGMLDVGQRGAAAQGGYGSEYAANQGNAYGQGANAKAAGITGSANAWGGALDTIGNAALTAYTLNKNPSSYVQWNRGPGPIK